MNITLFAIADADDAMRRLPDQKDAFYYKAAAERSRYRQDTPARLSQPKIFLPRAISGMLQLLAGHR